MSHVFADIHDTVDSNYRRESSTGSTPAAVSLDDTESAGPSTKTPTASPVLPHDESNPASFDPGHLSPFDMLASLIPEDDQHRLSLPHQSWPRSVIPSGQSVRLWVRPD
ncbi:hypothetical protein L873DRAFT_307116 [Choiromyces venosus 120613-1]|uniref:Uncharacterized protein n=1 Tax=Choiromyces venosus 120613-1 TaxID=1336337 RepID=A0A3N4J2X1_9PEZI|nr:hypothetical protein L873DRAFT_307116 [Choiromyces venosus 120613-1]